MEHRGDEFWKKLTAELEVSGLSQQAFADQRQVSVSTLRAWLYKLRRARGLPSFVPVRLDSSVEASTTAALVLELPHGLRLSVPAGTEPSYVAALVSALT